MLLGVVLSVLQYVYSSSLDVRVVALEHNADGTYTEVPAPGVLPSDKVTVIDIYGSGVHAGADIIGGLLPKAEGAHRPAVVLRLRGRSDVGSTFLGIVERYRCELEQAGGILLFAGRTRASASSLSAPAYLQLSGKTAYTRPNRR